MKFFNFHLMPYRHADLDAIARNGSAWVTFSNSHYDPQKGADLYHEYLDQMELADRLGFDGVCLNEHHQTAYGMMPIPGVLAGALARSVKRAKVAILGRALPLVNNPLTIAEEYAMLDNITRGRLIAGGGGLLLLGGSKAFAEGGYADTPLADIIPLELEARADSSFAREVSVQPTLVGNSHPVTRLAADAQASLGRWNTLPPLTAVNPIYRAKPGAALLLNGVDGSNARPSVILATQRYGSGRVIAFAVQNSWLWQMHHDIALEDQTHETLWRQLLRWLVSSVPQRLEVTLPGERVAPGEALELTAQLRSESYAPVSDAEVRALITSPTGIEQEVTLPWSAGGADTGAYHTTFVPREEGLYELHIRALEGDQPVSETEGYITVTEQAHEYQRAEMQAGLLQRISAETGGHFYTTADAASLSDAIQPVQSGTSVLEQRELWDMPILFLLMILLLAAEWSYRRWRGLI
jgi:hypothetical protein